MFLNRPFYKFVALVVLVFVLIILEFNSHNSLYYSLQIKSVSGAVVQSTEDSTVAPGARTENSNPTSGLLEVATSSQKPAHRNSSAIATPGLTSVESSSAVAQVVSSPAQNQSIQHFSFNSSTRGNGCKLSKCMEYFTEVDKRQYKKCQNRAAGELKGDCEFMRGEGRAPVALASLPGSGNTWVRGLLEKATGICTGAIYCDRKLKGGGFNGEGITSGTVLVVKTHDSHLRWRNKLKKGPGYGAVILLLRNPYHAIVAERNRRLTLTAIKHNRQLGLNDTGNPHLLSVGPQGFGANGDWNALVHTEMATLVRLVTHLILESPPDVPKLVVRYENLQKDRVREVSRVLDFLRFPYSHETLSQRLEEDFNSFHRNRHNIDFDPFTQSQKQFIDLILRRIVDRLSSRNSGETYGIEEYLRKP